MPEPYVLKGTRTVPRRGEMSNHLFLFNLKEDNMMPFKGYTTILKVVNGVGSSKGTLNHVSTLCHMILY